MLTDLINFRPVLSPTHNIVKSVLNLPRSCPNTISPNIKGLMCIKNSAEDVVEPRVRS